ncbi:MAG TPA: PAS domain-containing protein, partial [Bacteroidales bacterium]|nr:PAS domain-containing protein [Bacteroidales bacterium]
MDRMNAEFEDLIPDRNSDSDKYADQNDVEQSGFFYNLLLDSGEYMVLLIERKTGRVKDLNSRAKRFLDSENSPEPKILYEFFQKTDADRIRRILSDEKVSLSAPLHLHSRKEGLTISLMLFTIFPDPDDNILCLGMENTTFNPGRQILSRSNLLESVLETIPYPIFYKDTNGRFLGGNRHFLDDILGMSLDEIRGKHPGELENVSSDNYAGLIKKTDVGILQNGMPQNYQISLKTHSGQNKTFTVYKAPFQNTLDENKGLVGIMVDNTMLYNTTKRAVEGEEKLAEIFENITEIYFESSLDGEILFVSPSVEILTGYSKEELTGDSMYNFYESKKDRTSYLEALGEHGSLKDYLVKFKDKEGKIRDYLVNSRLIRDGEGNPVKISGTMRDVTENHRYQLALKESELKHRVLLENAGAQIIYTNNSGDIILINRIAAEFIGLNPSQLTEKNVADLYTSSHGSFLLKNINQVLLNRKGTLVESDVVHHGKTFWFLINFQPVMDDEGHVNGIVII